MGLIQREIEAAGIRTVSVVNLVNIAKIMRPPRMVQVKFSLGKIFGHAGDSKTQMKILKKAIAFALEGEPEELLVYD